MQTTLQAIGGPSIGLRIVVRQRQIVRVGRTQWADISVPADSGMSDVHFELSSGTQGCRLRNLEPAVTSVNGEPAVEAILRTGDEITAGETTFSVLVEGETADDFGIVDGAAATVDEPAADEVPADTPQAKTAADYCEELELSDEACQLCTDDPKPGEFLDLLTQKELYTDAVLLLAYLLPKPLAIKWGCGCVKGVQPATVAAPQSAAIEAVEKWITEPTEENRRAAEAAAEAGKQQGAACWMALGVFWSGGSIAPADLPEVPPAETLAARGVAAALMIAATGDRAFPPGDRYRGFLEQGISVAGLPADW